MRIIPRAIPHRTTKKLRTIFDLTVGAAFRGKQSDVSTYQAIRTLVTELLPRGRKTFTPSAEQEAIIELSRLQNVVVSARPGAGKTATAEAVVAANPHENVVVITYSKWLQLETARRLKRYTTCSVLTFHGMAGKLFSTNAYDDTILQALRREGKRPIWSGKLYDIVILDEMQDCTDDLFWLSCSFVSAIARAAGGRTPRIVVLGDERQAIYDFRRADPRFLTLSPSIMSALSPFEWSHLPLSKSFRLSHETACFVNEVFLGGEGYLTGTHNGPKPLYMCANLFDVNRLAEELVPLIRRYGPERTAILAPTIRNGPKERPLAKLTNLLSEQYRIPVTIPISDDVTLDGEVLGGKVCVSTYHQFKGNERDLVIVYGADAGYFEYINRHVVDDRCPNPTFVALTRAIKQLVVLQSSREPPMPFISLPKLKQTAQFVNISGGKMKPLGRIRRSPQPGFSLPCSVAVSDMARYILDEVLNAIVYTHVNITHISPPLPEGRCIKAPDKVLTDPDKMLYEAVSDINGLAVVAAYEYAIRRTVVSLGFSSPDMIQIPAEKHRQAAVICRAACAYEAKVSGYRSRQVQMEGHTFDWLGSCLDQATQRLNEQLHTSGRLEFESELRVDKFEVADSSGKPQKTKIIGQADIIAYANPLQRTKSYFEGQGEAGVCIWEIKFVKKLSLLHVVQACVYAYLWTRQHKSSTLPRIMLFNIRDGEKQEIFCPGGKSGLKRLIEDLLKAKYTTATEITTEKFLERCRNAIRDVETVGGKTPGSIYYTTS